MKEDVLGLNHLVSLSATCHTVRTRSSALSSGHLRIAPPKSSSRMPKCLRYHAASAALSPLLLKKTPPIPVIFATLPSCVSSRLLIVKTMWIAAEFCHESAAEKAILLGARGHSAT